MFHKALWMRQWKQGKYAVLLFWLTSLYIFPYKYYMSAVEQLSYSKMEYNDYIYYYSYYFNTFDNAFLQTVILIALACILIGWERNNQSTDFLFSMPFTRKDIFLTKWLFGVVNIIAVNTVCWISMYIIKNLSFHDQYQTFNPFHTYFLYITIVFIAVYTFTLFIGTITGNIVSQSSLTAILLFLPYGLALLLSGFIYTNTQSSVLALGEIESKTRDYLEHASILAPLESANESFWIAFDYSPIVEFDDEGNEISQSPQTNPMEQTTIPSAWNLITPIIYTLFSLPLALFLYMRTPNEHNGKLLLFPQLQKVFIFCTVLCFSLFGGRLLGGRDALLEYYIGFFIAGAISYYIFNRLLNVKLSFGGK